MRAYCNTCRMEQAHYLVFRTGPGTVLKNQQEIKCCVCSTSSYINYDGSDSNE